LASRNARPTQQRKLARGVKPRAALQCAALRTTTAAADLALDGPPSPHRKLLTTPCPECGQTMRLVDIERDNTQDDEAYMLTFERSEGHYGVLRLPSSKLAKRVRMT